MSSDEEYLLSEALSLLGQFDGLPNHDALEGFRLGLGIRQGKKIISFTKNPLEKKNLLGELFTTISHNQVISITYELFSNPNEEKSITLYPYLLKEYNRRWYLFASAEKDEKLLCFSLDRIKSVTPLTSHKYIECKENLDEFFDDIIGVTRHTDRDVDHRDVDHIMFWVSDYSKDYVRTKPLHDSQKLYRGNTESELREAYPQLSGGAFFSIDCIENYELIRELSTFGGDLLVLSPSHIQKAVYDRCQRMCEQYQSILSKE